MHDSELQVLIESIQRLSERVRVLEALETPVITGGGGGAPDSAAYLTLALTGLLSGERRFVMAGGATAVDGGANADYTVTVHDAVTLGGSSDPALTLVGQVLTLSDVLTPAEHTAIGNTAPHHAAVTLDANADTLLALSGQTLGLDTQTANTVWAGPTTGAAAVPTFRALVASDLSLYWTGTGIDAGGTTVIANGAGDVSKVITVQYVAHEVTGSQTGGGIATLEPGDSVVICNDGTDELTLSCAVDGSVTLARTAGADTFTAALWMVWL